MNKYLNKTINIAGKKSTFQQNMLEFQRTMLEFVKEQREFNVKINARLDNIENTLRRNNIK
ncbi:MAG: hypothetical protein LBS95_01480 [Mycoplasmataceae bacterium]|jgi:hypothetical protein|nr:hypothetical protein [Mycoplasmataceae bacterium]